MSIELSGAKAGRHDFFVGLELVGEIGDGYAERLWVVMGARGDRKNKMSKRTASMNSKRKGVRLEFSFGQEFLEGCGPLRECLACSPAHLAKRVVIHCFKEAWARSTAIGRVSYSVEKRVWTIRWILESRHR